MNETLTNLTTIVTDRYSFLEKCIYSIFMFPIIFFSIIGNILVIVAISKYSYLKITNNIFLASLAVSDLFVAIFAMNFYAFQVLYGGWPFKAFMCRFYLFSDILFSTASILHLLCVSFDRYLSISDEFTFYYTAEHPTKSWRVRIMLLSVWLVSATISSFCFTNYFTTNENVAMIQKLNTNNGYCDFIVNKSFRYFSACFSFWVPAIGLVIFYSLVMKKANKMERNKLKIYNSLHYTHASNQTVSVNNHNRNSSARSSGEVIWKRKYKALKTLGTVIAVFLICWSPYTYHYTFCTEGSWMCPKALVESSIFVDIMFWIGYFNSMINPFLYNFTNQDFQKAFRSLLNLKKNKNKNKKIDSSGSYLSSARKTTIDETKFII